jgi:hypothetical protein
MGTRRKQKFMVLARFDFEACLFGLSAFLLRKQPFEKLPLVFGRARAMGVCVVFMRLFALKHIRTRRI